MKKLSYIGYICWLISMPALVLATDGANTKPTLQRPIQFLYADINANDKKDVDEPLIVMSADDYKKYFGFVPLDRMLRSQIANKEYISLTQSDLEKLDKNRDSLLDAKDGNPFYKIYFVSIKGTIVNSFIVSTAKLVFLGKLKKILLNITRITQKNKKTKVDEAEFANKKEVEIKIQ